MSERIEGYGPMSEYNGKQGVWILYYMNDDSSFRWQLDSIHLTVFDAIRARSGNRDVGFLPVGTTLHDGVNWWLDQQIETPEGHEVETETPLIHKAYRLKAMGVDAVSVCTRSIQDGVVLAEKWDEVTCQECSERGRPDVLGHEHDGSGCMVSGCTCEWSHLDAATAVCTCPRAIDELITNPEVLPPGWSVQIPSDFVQAGPFTIMTYANAEEISTRDGNRYETALEHINRAERRGRVALVRNDGDLYYFETVKR